MSKTSEAEIKTPEQLIDEAIKRMNAKFGARTVIHMSDSPLDCEVISTGSLALDLALGVGGIPKKRITVIEGLPGAGKTTLMQHLIAQAQMAGDAVAYIDMEHKLDPRYAAACGVDMETCIFSQPPHGVAALEIAKSMIPHVGLIVVDSVYKLVTPAETEADVGDQHFAKLARLMSQELKSIQPLLGMSNCALVFVNQIRTGIGSSGRTYHTHPGGFALQFDSSVMIKMRRTGELPKNLEHPQGSGIIANAYIGKNNVAAPFKEVELSIIHSKGIDMAADLLEAAFSAGVITGGGGWYKFNDESINATSGKLPAVEVLRTNKELATAIREAALETIGRK